MAAEGAEVLHDSDAPSPEATNPVLPSPEKRTPVKELREFLVDAFEETDGGEALTFLRKHKIHSLPALKDKLLKDDNFIVDPVCMLFLRERLGIDNLRAEEAKLRANEAEAKDEEQKKEPEARAAETAKATEREEAKQAAKGAEKRHKQSAEAAQTQHLQVQGGALGSSVCVR